VSGVANALSNTVRFDVRDADSIAKALPNPCFDIVINNAGVALSGLLQDYSYQQIADIVNTNLVGTMLVTKHCLPYMLRQKKGAVVNVSSIWGIDGSACETVYSAAKAGIIGFTKALAKEVGLSGVTVNAVAPGMLDTPMTREYSDNDKQNFAESTMLGKNPTIDEVAELIRYLATNSAISGEIIRIG
jgi:3-oxoacyl-[acyl-carrier protein] reductase